MQVQKPRQGYKIVKSLFGKYEEIPENWKTDQIRDLVQTIQSGVSRLLSNEDIGYPILTSGNIQKGKFDPSDKKYWYKKDTHGVDLTKYKLDDKDVILNFINSIERIGKSCLFQKQDRDWIFTTNVFRIKTKPDKISQSFFYYLLNSKKIQKQIIGITQPAINQASFSKHFFELIHVFTPPVPEQQKIASILSNVDSLIQQTQKIIEQTQRLKKSFLYNLFTKGIGHNRLDTIVYGTRWMKMEIPSGWNYRKLNMVAKFRQGLQIAKINRYKEDGKNRMKLIKILDFYDDYDETGEYIDTPSNSKQSVICNKDDIIVARTGNTLGMILTNVEGVFHNNTFALDYNREIFLKMFFYYYLNTPQVQLYIKIISTRTGQPDLTHNEFSHLVVPIPPKSEQEKIISIISLIDLKIQNEKDYKSNLENLKKGLMQKLLTGQIRVKV